MSEIIWKDVQGLEGIYQVSSSGSVKRLERVVERPKMGHYLCKEKELKPSQNASGYLFVNIKGKSTNIHRLVAEAFLPSVEGKKFVNHKDGNRLNNRIDNLEWCCQSENITHALSEGLWDLVKGQNHYSATVSDEDKQKCVSLYATGKYTQKQLASQFNVARTTVSGWITGRTRRSAHV